MYRLGYADEVSVADGEGLTVTNSVDVEVISVEVEVIVTCGTGVVPVEETVRVLGFSWVVVLSCGGEMVLPLCVFVETRV